jgi:hypothetical protein
VIGVYVWGVCRPSGSAAGRRRSSGSVHKALGRQIYSRYPQDTAGDFSGGRGASRADSAADVARLGRTKYHFGQCDLAHKICRLPGRRLCVIPRWALDKTPTGPDTWAAAPTISRAPSTRGRRPLLPVTWGTIIEPGHPSSLRIAVSRGNACSKNARRLWAHIRFARSCQIHSPVRR